MQRAVTFTPFAGLGDNYLQASLLLNWAESQDAPVVVIVCSDGYVPPIEHRAMSAIYVQTELLDLLMPCSKVTFARLPTHHPFPYDEQTVHAFSPRVMFDRRLAPYYWPLNRNRFAASDIPARPYVAIAFDVVSFADHKAFTVAEVESIVECIEAQGYRVVDVGGARSLAEKAFIIDRAAAFVGAASGLAHIAAGLRKPTSVLLPEADHPDFHWYTAALKLNGARYQDRVRRSGGGLEFDLHLPPLHHDARVKLPVFSRHETASSAG